MHEFKKIFLLLIALSSTFQTQSNCTKKPRLAIVLVIDQFGYQYIEQCKAHFFGGLKYLMFHGIKFTNAYYPHALPETAVGHAALATGCYADTHGIIANGWIQKDGTQVKADDDADVATTAVFNPMGGVYDYGKSAHNIMVDGISDQVMLNPQPGTHQVWSLSYKSRAAIGMAGKLGHAIWFDELTGKFTSSKAYFDKIPTWVESFNTAHDLTTKNSLTWNLMYKKNSRAYEAVRTLPTTYASHAKRAGTTIQINKTMPADVCYHDFEGKDFHSFIKTPQANAHLLELAKDCITEHLPCTDDGSSLLLWVSLSSLDYIGHIYGPNSLEAIDMVYHLDCQLKNFIRWVLHRVKSTDILWVLTADHACGPSPEYLQEEGYRPAKRVDTTPIMKSLNETAKSIGNKDNIISAMEFSNIYFDRAKFDALDAKQQKKIEEAVCKKLRTIPGIKQAWTNHELANLNVDCADLVSFYKHQMYPGRSGDIIFQAQPFCLVNKYPNGSSHETPYNYDTHVPLIMYHKGNLEGKIINDTVYMLQFAPTLAQVLRVPKPSACTFNFLPGTVPHEIYTSR